MLCRWIISFSLCLVAGCQQYDFSVNERVVYSPRPLLTDFSIEDPALRTCIEQAINDNKINSIGGLQTLDCSGAGVRSISGLGSFSSLSWLNLGGNALVDIRELAVLLELRSALLDDNRIEDAAPLYRLPELAVVNLDGNDGLRCPQAGHWTSLERLTLPRHCR